jgi:ubiquinone/menaquinone biosynthesis C-methylase UbiE
MSTTFGGSVPDNYERFLRPLLFEPYAEDVANRVVLTPGMRVLEIACGTGIVTRKLLARLPGDAALVASDISEGMLKIAQHRVSPDPRLSWQPADALALPFEHATFDVLVCQFGVMFFPDKAKAWSEMYRVLKPGGQLLVSTWDALEQTPIAHTVHHALAQAFPANPPQFLIRVPWGFHDRDTLLQLTRDAGFNAIDLHQVELEGRSDSAADAALGLVTGTPVFPELKEKGLSPDVAVDAATRAVVARFGSAAIAGRLSALVVDARA